MSFFEQSFYDNTMKNWLLALGVGLVVFLFLRLLKAVAHRKVKAFAERTTSRVDDLVADLIYRRFQEEGIEFAYPTQTIFFNQEAVEP